MGPLFRFCEVIFGSSDDYLMTMIHIVADHILQIEQLRLTVDQGDVVDPIAALQLGVPVQKIQQQQLKQLKITT